MSEVLGQINEAIDWYASIKKDYSDVNELMYVRKKLSILLYRFSVELAESRDEWKSNEVKYESIKNQKRISLSSKHGATKGDWMARANVEQELKNFKEAEGVYWKMYYLYSSIKEILNEMNQRISYLKAEKFQSTFDE